MKLVGPHRSLGTGRWIELGQQQRGEVPRRIEVAAFEVIRGGVAVVHVGVHVRQRGKQGSGLGSERVLVAVACAEQPPDLSV